MRSSTSSSDWPKTWLLALVLTAILLGGWEVLARRMGHQPTMVDSPCLWSYWRDKAVGDAIVVLGDSRATYDIDRETILARGRPVIQLGLDGQCSPIAVLADLAADDRFHGIVLCGVNEACFVQQNWDAQRDCVEYYHKAYTFNQGLNVMVSCWLRDRIALLSPALKLDVAILNLVKHGHIKQLYIDTSPDRVRRVDYGLLDPPSLLELRQSRENSISPYEPSACEWLADAMAVEAHVRAIQSRGGRVVYIKYPVEGKLWAWDQRVYPREDYWDALAARTEAVCVHFRDCPELSCYECPDASHIDYADSPAFTRALMGVLEREGVFLPPSGGQPCLVRVSGE